ncbi:tRNA lysidine(34) synthetase TilS [Thioclava sp. BHET1]|nr:tRNA lysidine(34) synthetase TilS [Thioclava sp. BHET1]
MATLHLLADQFEVHAVTVDHGLRPEAASEARAVAAACAKLGVPHEIVHWDGTRAQGNLMDAARRARMELIGAWAQRHAIAHVALGHTADDQAETFLMRLSREAGLEGLSGMRRRYRAEGVSWHRPFLDVTRADLRAHLREIGVAWIEDPSNADPRFERVRARHALAGLAELGITAQGLSRTVGHLAQARDALDAGLAPFVARHIREEAGALYIDADAFTRDLPDQLRRRVLNAALQWVAGAPYPPRGAKLDRLLGGLVPCTLHGCQLIAAGQSVLICREPAAIADLRVPASRGHWDRWHVEGPASQGLEIGALGPNGLAQLPDWRALGVPRTALLSTPALWAQEKLISAPVAGFESGWKARMEAGSFAVTNFRR